MKGLRTITANEARAYLDGKWRIKLNEIYDGVRENLEVGANCFAFCLEANQPYTNEIVLKQLEQFDGYRIVKMDKSERYTIFW
jgi:hypothetical protein